MSLPTDKRPRKPDQTGPALKRAKPAEAEPAGLQAKANAIYAKLEDGLSTKLKDLLKLAAAQAGGVNRAQPQIAAVLKQLTGAGVSKPMTSAETFVVAMCCRHLWTAAKHGNKYTFKEDTASPLYFKMARADGSPLQIDCQRALYSFLATHMRFFGNHIKKVTTDNQLAKIEKGLIDRVRVAIGILIWQKLETPTDADVQEIALVVLTLIEEFPGRTLIPRPAPHYVGVSGVAYPL